MLKQVALCVLAIAMVYLFSAVFALAIAMVTTHPAPCPDASCGQPYEQDP